MILASPFAGSDTDVLHSHIDKLPTETGWKYSYTLCGKENVQKANVVKHVESVHFPNLFSYQCKFWEKQFTASNSLYAHVSRNHKNWNNAPLKMRECCDSYVEDIRFIASYFRIWPQDDIWLLGEIPWIWTQSLSLQSVW